MGGYLDNQTTYVRFSWRRGCTGRAAGCPLLTCPVRLVARSASFRYWAFNEVVSRYASIPGTSREAPPPPWSWALAWSCPGSGTNPWASQS